MKQDEKHLDIIRSLPCCSCGKPPRSQAAHIRKGSNAGMGRKPFSDRCVPLCAPCHISQHSTSEVRFWYRFGGWERAMVLAKRLYNAESQEERITEVIKFWKGKK